MANSDNPSGLTPIRHGDGAPYNGAANPYGILVGYGTALYVGDPVVLTGTSNTIAVTPSGGDFGDAFQPGTLPTINRSGTADGSYVTGVIVAFDAAPDSGLDKQYNPASTARVAYVADDPDLVFEIQEDSAGTALAATDVGSNCNLLAGTGSTVTGRSGFELDRSDVNSTAATRQVRIKRLVNRVDNAIGDSAKWEVTINQHTTRYATPL